MNVPNQGAIAGLQDDDVVEVPSVVTEHGCFPLAIGHVPVDAMSLITPVKTYERLTATAALTGDYETALKALIVHPLIPSFSKRIANTGKMKPFWKGEGIP